MVQRVVPPGVSDGDQGEVGAAPAAASGAVADDGGQMDLGDSEDAELALAIQMSLAKEDGDDTPVADGGTSQSTNPEGGQQQPPQDAPAPPAPMDQAGQHPDGEYTTEELIKSVANVIWGNSEQNTASEEVLRRWCQGFYFDAGEPTALVQKTGGPCGVLAPVQAYILKNLLFSRPENPRLKEMGDWRKGTVALAALVCALADILANCSPNKESFRARVLKPTKSCRSFAEFQQSLDCITFESKHDLEEALSEMLPVLQGPFGVLIFTYSCVATRGPAAVTQDLGMDIEPLISMPFGHASVSLVNLLLTGVGTYHVHDGIQDVGMPLLGISEQPDIGYLSIMEHLRYITVGTLYKNPKYPIWVLGSETHMTVLFSLDDRLVKQEDGESTIAQVERAFQEHDQTGGGFIMPDQLPKLLTSLGLDSSEENVTRLNGLLGGDIVLLTSFLEVQYPGVSRDSGPTNFTLYHYNGIPYVTNGPVQFVRGVATVSTPTDFGSTPMMQLLRTKWPRLQVEWTNDVKIS